MGIYQEIGVRKLINCMGPVSKIGGSLMPKEVVAAMEEAAKSFVNMDELLEQSGKKIAKLVGAPAAFITSGAAAGLAVSVAACMTGCDPVKAKQLPDTFGMRSEVIIHHCHRIHYDQAVRLTGSFFVEIGFSDWSDKEDLEACITEDTVAILYVAKFSNCKGSVPLQEVIEVAKEASIPVIVDAADEVPPMVNLSKFTDMGANLVVYSGGKGLCGPQGSGLILGDEELIRACSVNSSPNYGIGRPMKVDKEEIVGLTRAIELYVKKDFDLEIKNWENQRDHIINKIFAVPNIKYLTDKPLPPGTPGSFYLPSLYIDFDKKKLGLSKDEVIEKLWGGNPRIAVDKSSDGIVIRMMMVQNGEEKIIAERLLEIFKK